MFHAGVLHSCLLLAQLAFVTVLAAPIVTIPLDKQYVPVVRKGKTVSYKTAYFGKIFVGMNQQQGFSVIFDTGSAHLFVPSGTCHSEVCNRHTRYDKSLSSTSVAIDHHGKQVAANATTRDQVAITYGTGEVTGEFVREMVCLSDHSVKSNKFLQPEKVDKLNDDCTEMRVILATEMTEEPFKTFEFDGVLGLGLDALAVDPEFSFFGQMSKMHNFKEARFGYFLSRSDSVPSEISFGDYDERRVASDLMWAPVHKPELGFWQVKIRSVTVGTEVLPICEDGDCVAIADTGTSLIGIPRQVGQRLHWLLARKVPDNPDEIDCRQFPGPDMVFDLGDGVKLSVGPEDYSRATAMRVHTNKTNTSQVICRASLLPIDGDEVLGPKAWILGEPLLRKYYTAYDWRNRQIGFAPAVQPQIETEQTPTHTIYGAPPVEPPTPTTVVV